MIPTDKKIRGDHF